MAFSFGITWGLGLLAVLAPNTIEARFGEFGPSNPLFIVAVYAPALTALVLVWRHHGLRGIASFLRRLTLWRMPGAWWVGLVVGIPVAYYLGAAVGGTWPSAFPFSPWYSMLPMALFHWQLNNPVWPDTMAWASVLFIGAAALIVLLRRDTMLTRAGAVTEVLHPDDAAERTE